MNYNEEELNLKKDIAKVVTKKRHELEKDKEKLTNFYLWQMKDIKSIGVNKYKFTLNEKEYFVDITPGNQALDYFSKKEVEEL